MCLVNMQGGRSAAHNVQMELTSYLREKDQGVSFCTRRLRIVAGGEFLKHEEASVCTYGERKKERKKEGKKE
jgi:hypothetical protein